MTIPGRYSTRGFLAAFAFTVVQPVSVICVMDHTEKNDDFPRHGLSGHKTLFGYYVYVFPYFANMRSPITVFMAVVFVTAQLAARTEIAAIMASGVSFRRLLVPYAVGAGLLGLLTFAVVGWVLPLGNKHRAAGTTRGNAARLLAVVGFPVSFW